MNEANVKIFKSSLITMVITTIFCYFCMTPSSVVAEPTVKLIGIDDKQYYIVKIDGEEWATKTYAYTKYSSWTNLKTGKTCINAYNVPFCIDKGELWDIIRKWNVNMDMKEARKNIKIIKKNEES